TDLVSARSRIEFLGAFESTYQPQHDVDIAETTRHTSMWREDLALLTTCGVSSLRYPVRWHRVEEAEGCYDWRHTDAVLDHLRDTGMRVVLDLCHHMSYPRWLAGGFADPRFGDAYLRFAEAVARRYPWMAGYTLFNEPFTTLFLAGSCAVFPPRLSGPEGFVRLTANVYPAVTEAARMYRDLVPKARYLHVDSCEQHDAAGPEGEEYTALANDRRFLLTDIMLGRHLDPDRPFLRELREAGGERLLEIRPGHIDVLGLDYYAHSQWQFSGWGRGIGGSPAPAPLADVIENYWRRYGLECAIGETNIRGNPSDRASWLRYTLEQCEIAVARGVNLTQYCWFPTVDSCDWSSLLVRSEGNVDPVGVFWVDSEWRRRSSSMSESYARAAGGESASSLPAYRFKPPVSRWLAGYAPHVAHWDWVDPPGEAACTNAPPVDDWVVFEVRAADADASAAA
ncbi:MAG: family 1 glycosylhydrolase, partial [Candidatus Dormibacteria bacterium]